MFPDVAVSVVRVKQETMLVFVFFVSPAITVITKALSWHFASSH